MSGQYPQQNPWHGPPNPPPWQGAPPGPRKRRGRIVVAVVGILALLAGGGVGAWQLTSDDSDNASADDPAPSDAPTEPGPADPSPSPTEPNPAPVSGDPWGALPPDAEVNEVSDALEGAGYACYDTLDAAMLTPGEPITVNDQSVLVRRCYLDPATSRDEEQTVSIQTAPDGSVNGIRVVISALLHNDDKRTSRWFGDVVHALTGPVLTSGEARQVLAGRTPSLAWGTAALDTNRERTSYRLDVISRGSDLAAVPATNTGVSLAQVKAHYSSKGFSCRRTQPGAMLCERSGRGHALVVNAVDVCHTARSDRLASCAGNKTVSSLTFDALFDSGLPERIYGDIFDDFITGSIVFSYQDRWSSQIDGSLGQLDFLKPHRVDLEGLHVELLPNTTAAFNPQYEQAYQVHIEGVCATDC